MKVLQLHDPEPLRFQECADIPIEVATIADDSLKRGQGDPRA